MCQKKFPKIQFTPYVLKWSCVSESLTEIDQSRYLNALNIMEVVQDMSFLVFSQKPPPKHRESFVHSRGQET